MQRRDKMNGDRYCPIAKKMISEYECFDVHMVIEDGAPKWTARSEIVNQEDFEKRCCQCSYHYQYEKS